MTGGSTAKRLASAQPRQFVTLDGYPEGETSRWHVNNAPRIESADSITLPLVLQADDGSEHWLVIKLLYDGGSWMTEDVTSFEGDPPQGMEAGDHGESIDPDQISLVKIENA